MLKKDSPFLQTLAQTLYSAHGKRIHDVTIVFPNKRSGAVFSKYLASLTSAPSPLPTVLDIEAFTQRLYPLTIPDTLTLTAELYQVWKGLQPSCEPFERFYFWGATLLK